MAILLAVIAIHTTAATAYGRTAVFCGGAVPLGQPQLGMKRNAFFAHELDNAVHAAFFQTHIFSIVGLVMDEPASDPLTECLILSRVEQEGVPADIHELRRREGITRIFRAKLQEPERAIHDELGLFSSFFMVFHHSIDQPLPCLS